MTEQQKLVMRLAPEVQPIRADPVQLDQILLNLTINARDAMPDGGMLRLAKRPSNIFSSRSIPRKASAKGAAWDWRRYTGS